MSDKDYIPTFGKELFEPITIEFLNKQLQAKTDECENATRIAHKFLDKAYAYDIQELEIEKLTKENTALKQQLDISVEALEDITFECGLECCKFIAKTALDRIKEK